MAVIYGKRRGSFATPSSKRAKVSPVVREQMRRTFSKRTKSSRASSTRGVVYRRKSNKRGKKTYRKKRSVKRARVSKVTRNGVLGTVEYTGAITESKCAYLGHNSVPVKRCLQIVSYALVKRMAIKIGVIIEDYSDVVPTGVSTGDTFTLSWSNSNETTSTINTSVYTVGAGTKWSDVADKIYADLILVNVSEDVQWTTYTYKPSSGRPVIIFLKNSKVTFMFKSTLKYQNRTVGATGDDEIDVNNQPLIGFKYEGPGAGTQHRNGAGQTAFIADGAATLITKPAVGAPDEPPKKAQLDKVKKVNGMRIDPGQIQFSYLSSYKTMKWNKFFSTIGSSDFSRTYLNSPLGEFRFFAFEKALAQTGEGSIKIAWELNLEYGCEITPGSMPYTATILSVS